MTDLKYHRHLATIATEDVNYVLRKDTQYAGSWKRRGGAGAWFTIVRPWDRLENMVTSPCPATRDEVTRCASPHDIFECIEAEGLAGPDGSVIACVRDLRRYLLLVEAHMTEEMSSPATQRAPDQRHEFPAPGTPEDGGHHARQSDLTHYPWVVHDSHAGVPADCADAWFEAGCGFHVLEPRISPELWTRLPLSVRDCYLGIWRGSEGGDLTDAPSTRGLHALWLRVGDAPESERSRWRVLPREMNHHEYTQAGTYGELYSWHNSPGKWILRPAHEAWAEGPE